MSSGFSAPRRRGVLVDWNDRRGFGFIDPAGGGPLVFVDTTAFPRGRRPANGSAVTYVEARDERDRPQASDVRYDVRPRNVSAGSVLKALAVAAVFGAVLVTLWAMDRVSGWIPLADALLSLVAFVMYANDKAAAEKGQWRTAEVSLHLVALVGGWPGALVARPYLRHKTRKEPFRTIFWLTVAANCGALVWLVVLWPSIQLS